MFLKRVITAFAVLFIGLLTLWGGLAQEVSAAQTRLGGMNLNGYCGSLNRGNAILSGNNWICTTGATINMTSACIWQYPNQNATATQETAGNPYSWACYSNTPSPTVTPTRTATPTPTRMAIPTPTRVATPTPTRTATPTPTRVPTATPTVAVTPTPTTAPSGNTLVIFEDSLGSGWRDASYNATSSVTSAQVYSNASALAATINNSGGLDFQSVNGQSTNGYTTLHFALRATQANQRYEVYADRVYGQPSAAPVSLSNYGGQPTTGAWRIYDIPLTALGVSNVTVKDFVIHDASDANQPIVYVDQVQLRGSGASVTPTPPVSVTPVPTTVPTQTPTPTPTQPATGNYYMALGDSFGFGFHLAQFQQQQATNSYNPASFNDGYDAVFFRNLQTRTSGIQEINYACPGETASSFINGGCVNHTASLPLHNNYPVSQSQLQAAISFLQANPNRVSTITIDIGVNDTIAVADICQAQANPVQCYNDRTPGVLAAIRQNYNTILDALRQAAPQANIIVLQSPNPVYYDGSDALVNGLNTIVTETASARGLRVANTYSIFTADNICSYTNFCASPSDFHPTALGYSAMAGQVWSTSGY